MSLLNQWIRYHAYLGVERFEILDRTGEGYPYLLPHIKTGLIEYYHTPAQQSERGAEKNANYNFDQDLNMEACRARNRKIARWILMWDWDEYPVFPQDSPTPIISQYQATCIHRKSIASLGLKPTPYAPLPYALVMDSSDTSKCHSMLLDFLSYTQNLVAERVYDQSLIAISLQQCDAREIDGAYYHELNKFLMNKTQALTELYQSEHHTTERTPELQGMIQRELAVRIWTEFDYPLTHMFPECNADGLSKWFFKSESTCEMTDHRPNCAGLYSVIYYELMVYGGDSARYQLAFVWVLCVC